MAKKKQKNIESLNSELLSTESLNEVFTLPEEMAKESVLIQDKPSKPLEKKEVVKEERINDSPSKPLVLERNTNEKTAIQTDPLSMLGDRFEIWKDGKKIFDTDNTRNKPKFIPGFILLGSVKISTIGINYIVK